MDDDDLSSAATAQSEAPVTDTGATPASEPPDQGAPPEEAPADAGATPEGTADGSLTSPIDAEHSEEAGGQPGEQRTDQPDPVGQLQERYKHLETRLGRSQRELSEAQQRLQQFGDIDPQQVRQLLEQRQREAEERDLRPFHRRHPKHADTMARFRTIREAQEALRRAGDDESKIAFVNQLYEGKFGREDVQAYQEWQQHQEQLQEQIASDPEGFVEQRAEAAVYRILERYEQMQDVRAESRTWLQDNDQLLKKHSDDVQWAMTHPVRRDVGLALAQTKAENAELRKQLGLRDEKVASAEAQRAALNQAAEVTRDGASVPTGDPAAEARAKGLRGAAAANYIRARLGR